MPATEDALAGAMLEADFYVSMTAFVKGFVKAKPAPAKPPRNRR